MLAIAQQLWKVRLDSKFLRGFVRSKTTEATKVNETKNTIAFKIGGKMVNHTVINVQTEANKFFNWFHSVRGQQLVGSFWIVSSMLAALYQIGPHGIFRNWVKSCYQSFSQGVPTYLSADMTGIIRDVLTDLDLKQDEVGELHVFVTTLSEPRGWGQMGSVLLGYPQFFQWRNPQQVPMNSMRFGGGWKPGTILTTDQLALPEAEEFSSSVILSNEARKFAIAKEFARVQLVPQYKYAFLNSCWILLTYNFGRLLNKKLELFKQMPLKRGIMYIGLLPTMIYSYMLVKDFVTKQTEKTVVKTVVALGPQYANGGEEYYNKMMSRNKCLRVLESAQSKYNLEGELLQGLLRTKYVPIAELRELCKSV